MGRRQIIFEEIIIVLDILMSKTLHDLLRIRQFEWLNWDLSSENLLFACAVYT